MIRRPPRSTRTDTLFPYTTLFRSIVRRAGTAVSGSCFRPETTMTPVQNRMQFDRVWSLFDDAIARGARVAVGGERHRGEGLIIPPTLVEGVGAGVRQVDTEQVGLVLPILAFRSEEQRPDIQSLTRPLYTVFHLQ